MTTELHKETLEWAAQWIEGSLKGEPDQRVREFGKNMATTLRAAMPAPAPPVQPEGAVYVDYERDPNTGEVFTVTKPATPPATTAAPKCVKCGHDKYWSMTGTCGMNTGARATIPRPCGCKCEFAEPVTTTAARAAAREWMNTYHAAFKTNKEREDALVEIITHHLAASPSPTSETLGYVRRKCSSCGEGLGFSEGDPCDRCGSETPGGSEPQSVVRIVEDEESRNISAKLALIEQRFHEATTHDEITALVWACRALIDADAEEAPFFTLEFHHKTVVYTAALRLYFEHAQRVLGRSPYPAEVDQIETGFCNPRFEQLKPERMEKGRQLLNEIVTPAPVSTTGDDGDRLRCASCPHSFCKNCNETGECCKCGTEIPPRTVAERLAQHEHIDIVEGVLGGVTPLVSRTRLGVHHVLTCLHNGNSIEYIADCYNLSPDAIKDAIAFAQEVYDDAVDAALRTPVGESK